MTRDEQIAQIKGRQYGGFAGEVHGIKPSRCHELVAAGIWHRKQCTRKPGHGLGGLFCRQHAKNNPEIVGEK